MLTLCLVALFFPAFVDGYVRGERGHPQSTILTKSDHNHNRDIYIALFQQLTAL